MLQLHPDNPHYFAWRGRPEVLLTSAEHYGAVLNLDFDYAKYLETLRRDGCNLTRTFTGGAFGGKACSKFRQLRNWLPGALGRLTNRGWRPDRY